MASTSFSFRFGFHREYTTLRMLILTGDPHDVRTSTRQPYHLRGRFAFDCNIRALRKLFRASAYREGFMLPRVCRSKRGSDSCVDERDRIAGVDHARADHCCVAAAKTPPERCRITGASLRVVHGSLNAFSVDIQCATGYADLGKLDHHITCAVALSQPQGSAGEAAGGDVLAQSAGIKRKAPCRQFLDSFRRNEQNRLAGAAVNLPMPPSIADDAAASHLGRRDSAFGYTALRNIDLNDYGATRVAFPLGLSRRA